MEKIKYTGCPCQNCSSEETTQDDILWTENELKNMELLIESLDNEIAIDNQ